MIQSPNTFSDPVERPVRFTQRLPNPVFAFGESSFPVSFSLSRNPRTATFAGSAAVQLGVLMTDKNVYSSPSVVQLAVGESQEYILTVVGKDVTDAQFYLTTRRSDGTLVVISEYGLAEARQPSFEAGIAHLFSTGPKTIDFDPVTHNGDQFYPSATMRLTVHRVLSSGIEDVAAVDVPDGGQLGVVLVPAMASGVVDVEIDVVLMWYENEERTIEAENPPVLDLPRFGLRMYASEPGKMVEKVAISRQACIATEMYPTTILRRLGGNSVTLAYWGRGSDGKGLFCDREEGVEVSINGLAIQNGSETVSYILENQLEDYEMSSDSSASESSLNSASSLSTVLNTSSESSVSPVSASSLSSESSSSRSSWSSSSSSSLSLSSTSTLSDESSLSSTAMLAKTSSSSVLWNISKSSSSSIMASVLARYSFSSPPDALKRIEDESGNGNNLVLGTVSGGIAPPTWGSTYGISGGGFLFTADSSHSNYAQAMFPSWISSARSIAFWAKTGGKGNKIGIPFCVSNGFLGDSNKTEFAVQLDATSGKLSAWIKMNGIMKWEASTAEETVPSGIWTHFSVVHNGNTLVVYINGSSSLLTFSIGSSVSKRLWLADLTTSANPPDRVVLGGAPRYFAPYVALGFSGHLDELVIWDEALSGSDVESEFSRLA